MDKVILVMDELESFIEVPNSAECTEYMKAFCGLLHANSFLTCTILKALKETVRCYEEDIKPCKEKDLGMEYLS